MNYEKKYKEALSWIKNVYPLFEGAVKEDAEHFFPELKESEDERIRKAILTGLIDCRDAPDLWWSDFGGIPIDDCIAWIEKQGEQKPINDSDEEIVEAVKDTSILDMVEPKFKVGDKIENRFSSHRVYDIIGVDLDNQEYHCKHSYCNNEEDLPFECADKDYELYDDTPTPPDYGDEVKFEPKIYDIVFYYNKGEIKTGKIVDYRADEGIYELGNGVELLPNEIIGIGK